MAKVTRNGRPVHNPLAKFVVGTLALVGTVVGFIYLIVVGIPLLILSAPVHVLLRLAGRQGFAIEDERGRFVYAAFSLQGFKRA